MDRRDDFFSMDDDMDMEGGIKMIPYMGISMHPMMSMMAMGNPMMPWNAMPNMGMNPMMGMHPGNMPMMGMQNMMPMNPMMMEMDVEPMGLDEDFQDEDYINYMINMNKYMTCMYEAQSYRMKAMDYINRMEK